MSLSLFESTQSGFQWVADRVWKVEHAFERANATGAKARSARMRIFILLVGLVVGFVCLAGFATRGALSGDKSRGPSLTVEPNARAQLVDRNGRLLATDVDDYNLFVNPGNMTAQDRGLVEAALTRLFPDVNHDQIARIFRGRSRMLLTSNIQEDDRQRILSYGLPGVSFEAHRVRNYPLGSTGSAYIGMTMRGGGGMSGAEKALNSQISAQAVRDQPVTLAMDLRVQGALENELRAGGVDQRALSGVGIVTNVRTGEILALASWPDFDLNRPAAFSDQQRRNHASVDRFEVGSIFKVISIGVGLDTGVATMNSVYDARQPLVIGTRKIHDDHMSTTLMTLEDVFIHSSNIGTSKIALAVGAARMTQYYKALGLFHAADSEFVEPAPPILPRRWTDNDLASSAFGQAMAVTPLSYVEAADAVLNGGYLRPLTIHKYDGTSPLGGTRVFSPTTTRTMLDLMRDNVVKGSGTRANVPGLRVGGKTGTAQKPVNGRYTSDDISSFAAVFPTDGPVDSDRYMVLILYDSPQGSPNSNGSRLAAYVAAPVAGHVIERIAPFLGVNRVEDKFSDPLWDKAPVRVEDTTGANE
ncbi:penicillin-binding protein 2 [Asticcacaulis sp. EMRT-3]|uniref:peptidoglycan D,D-transpeptidase FtsI family protein n=1 Tax=Asticcacaulis sp. EMRT-3 TaxID=3040349 RepID=UPI0024AF5836|nr:penicillin-binding protein 2 [Asticcacaulis sp. EMRT-3]MDI7773752.1 penicillin-binding protein 2 [Asticcacaulis sp. EMRT-3]